MADDDWLKAGFAEIYPAHVEAFAHLLIVLRRGFRGDLDQLLILTVIGERHHNLRQDRAALSYETFGRTPWRDSTAPTVNPHSLAEFTGIPRETVRRKVAALIERGWVIRDPQGNLHPTSRAAAELAGCTEAALAYLGAVAAAFDRARARNAPAAANAAAG